MPSKIFQALPAVLVLVGQDNMVGDGDLMHRCHRQAVFWVNLNGMLNIVTAADLLSSFKARLNTHCSIRHLGLHAAKPVPVPLTI